MRQLLLTVLVCVTALAGDFDTGMITWTQPNSATFTARQWGDEWIWHFRTTTNYSVIQGGDGYYYYATLNGVGEFIPTGAKVGIDAAPAGSLNLNRTAARIAVLEERRKESDSERSIAGQWYNIGQAPLQTFKVAILLIEFAEFTQRHMVYGSGGNQTPPQFPLGWPKAYFDSVFFSRGYWYDFDTTDTDTIHPNNHKVSGSMADYFWEQTRGSAVLTGRVINPDSAGIPQWLTLCSFVTQYGSNHQNPAIFRDAFRIADSLGWIHPDSGFTHIAFLRPGGNNSWGLGWFAGGVACPSHWPVSALPMVGAAENIGNVFLPIGTLTHEFGHSFFSFNDQYGIIADGTPLRQYCIMSTHFIPPNGHKPPSIDPIYRVERGWVEPITLTAGAYNYRMPAYSYSDPQWVKILMPTPQLVLPQRGVLNQYFLLMVRGDSSYDASVPQGSPGKMEIWRATFDQPHTILKGDEIDLIEADDAVSQLEGSSTTTATNAWPNTSRRSYRKGDPSGPQPLMWYFTNWFPTSDARWTTQTTMATMDAPIALFGIHDSAGWTKIDTIAFTPLPFAINADNISQTSARLNFSVNANALLCTTKVYWQRFPSSVIDSATVGTVTGVTTANLTYQLPNGLVPNSSYGWWVKAKNQMFGWVAVSNQSMFNTLPAGANMTIAADSGKALSPTQARFWGRTFPDNAQDTVWVMYRKTIVSTWDSVVAGIFSGSTEVPFNVTIGGLDPSTEYTWRFHARTAQADKYSSTGSFTTLAATIAPVATTLPATSVGQTSALFNGTVNPGNGWTRCGWVYATVLGSWSTDTIHAIQSPLSGGSTNVTIFQVKSGLASGTKYYFRAWARNSAGEHNGAVDSMTTQAVTHAPIVITDAATLVTHSTARLNGRVDPGGLVTTAEFLLGDAPGVYNIDTLLSFTGLLTGDGYDTVFAQVMDLEIGKRYYYRVRAWNSIDTTDGAEVYFDALSVTPPTITMLATANIGAFTSQIGATVGGSGTVDVTFYWWRTGVVVPDSFYIEGLILPGSQSVVHDIAGLWGGTSHFATGKARNAGGTSYADTVNWSTLIAIPTLISDTATIIQETSVRLTAVFRTNGDTTRLRFQVVGGALDTTITVGATYTGFELSAFHDLGGLAPGTTYTVTTKLDNSAGEFIAPVFLFTTEGGAPLGPVLLTKQPGG